MNLNNISCIEKMYFLFREGYLNNNSKFTNSILFGFQDFVRNYE